MTQKKPRQAKNHRAEQRREALLKFMADRNLKILPWATSAGVSEAAVRNFLRGRSQSLSQDISEKLATAEGVTPGAMFGEEGGPKKVRVINYIGAGAQVFPIDDYPMGDAMYEVEAPEGADDPDELVGLEVRGDSMRPIMPGWVVMYRRHSDGVPPECLGKLCIVALEDGQTFIKMLRPGYQPGTYNLESWSADPISNVRLAWAATISWIKPA